MFKRFIDWLTGKDEEKAEQERLKRAIRINMMGKTHADCRHYGKATCLKLSTIEPDGLCCPYQNHMYDWVEVGDKRRGDR